MVSLSVFVLHICLYLSVCICPCLYICSVEGGAKVKDPSPSWQCTFWGAAESLMLESKGKIWHKCDKKYIFKANKINKCLKRAILHFLRFCWVAGVGGKGTKIWHSLVTKKRFQEIFSTTSYKFLKRTMTLHFLKSRWLLIGGGKRTKNWPNCDN